MIRKITVKKERHQQTSIDLRSIWHRTQQSPAELDFPDDTPLLCGYAVPDFQRESVWSVKQKRSFIESTYYGYDLGTIMISNWKMRNNKLLEYSECLIDGQQRLTSLRDYWNDEFKVFGYYWSELTKGDRTQMFSTNLALKRIDSIDRNLLIETYNRLNFSGTQHEESDRAT